MDWSKLSTDFDLNPKARAAGLLGRAVYIHALQVNGRHRMDGCVPASYFDPRYLAEMLQIGDLLDELTPGIDLDDPKDVTIGDAMSRAVTRCLDSGLLREEKCESGRIFLIVGWDDSWRRDGGSE